MVELFAEATDDMFGDGRDSERHGHAPLRTTGAGANLVGSEGEQPPVQLMVLPSHPQAASSTIALHGIGVGRTTQMPGAEQLCAIKNPHTMSFGQLDCGEHDT